MPPFGQAQEIDIPGVHAPPVPLLLLLLLPLAVAPVVPVALPVLLSESAPVEDSLALPLPSWMSSEQEELRARKRQGREIRRVLRIRYDTRSETAQGRSDVNAQVRDGG